MESKEFCLTWTSSAKTNLMLHFFWYHWDGTFSFLFIHYRLKWFHIEMMKKWVNFLLFLDGSVQIRGYSRELERSSYEWTIGWWVGKHQNRQTLLVAISSWASTNTYVSFGGISTAKSQDFQVAERVTNCRRKLLDRVTDYRDYLVPRENLSFDFYILIFKIFIGQTFIITISLNVK